jgi:hypothetical protein
MGVIDGKAEPSASAVRSNVSTPRFIIFTVSLCSTKGVDVGVATTTSAERNALSRVRGWSDEVMAHGPSSWEA